MFRPARIPGPLLLLACIVLASAGSGAAATDPQALRDLNAKAKAGDAEAQFRLGQSYAFNTIITLVDPVQADFWFAKAAGQNHLGAILSLVDLHQAFPALSTSDADLAELLGRAADMGHTHASVRLGKLLWQGGRNLAADRPAGYQRLKDGALRGDESAQLFLAECGLGGDGVKRDPAAARAILQWAADRGSVAAAMHLHVLDDKDRRFASLEQVARQLRKLAKTGDARAQGLLGQAYETGVNIDRSDASETLAGRFSLARDCYAKAASMGDAEAQARLGVFLAKGLGGAPDAKQARNYFEQSAANGSALGQYHLAMLMLQREVPGEPDRIIALLQLATRTQPNAHFMMGMMCYQGDRVSRSAAAAAEHFERAARNGHAAACVNLGVIAANGEAGAVSLYTAAKWWTLAALAGSAEGSSLLGRISDRLKPEERERVLQELRDWQASVLRENSLRWVDLTVR